MSFLNPRDPSIDVYNRPMPVISQPRLEPFLQEEDETSVDATASTDNVSLGESRVDVYLRLRGPGPVDPAHRRMYEATWTELKVRCPQNDAAGQSKPHTTRVYSFTKVFEPLNTQHDIFFGAIKNHINSEEHAVFAAYGTSASGKTFTLLGDNKNPGIVPRAVQMIFTKYKDQIYQEPQIKLTNGIFEVLEDDRVIEEEMLRRKIFESPEADEGLFDRNLLKRIIDHEEDFKGNNCDKDYVYIWVSFVEIYNEKIFDVLADTATKRPELKVINNKGHPFVKNLTQIYVKNTDDVMAVLNYGLSRVRYSSTAINATSSRSHSLFTIQVIKISQTQELKCISYRFADLAGSERLTKTHNVGHRLKEAQNINTSLMYLGKCLSVLHENRQKKQNTIVPFRESKLTQIIQNALLGNENLILMVNLHPIEQFFEENLRVLEFAAIAREIVHTKSPIKKVKTARVSILFGNRQNQDGNREIIAENYSLKMQNKTLMEENALYEENLLTLKEEYSILKAENNFLQNENSSLREDIDILHDKVQELVTSGSDKEIRIRRELVDGFNVQMKKQKEISDLMHEHNIRCLKKDYDLLLKKYQERIDELEDAQIISSDEEN